MRSNTSQLMRTWILIISKTRGRTILNSNLGLKSEQREGGGSEPFIQENGMVMNAVFLRWEEALDGESLITGSMLIVYHRSPIVSGLIVYGLQ